MGIQLHEKYKENFDVSNESPRQNVEDEVLLLFFSWLYRYQCQAFLSYISTHESRLIINSGKC
jgi:hypothetical protein